MANKTMNGLARAFITSLIIALLGTIGLAIFEILTINITEYYISSFAIILTVSLIGIAIGKWLEHIFKD
ncbi:MAG TPA: hypothetical protein VJH20_00650 [Candidatus Nanoarchaeia archaeon]|nr:hypothetical protein [Candidatus Nanoarchaeia archaeon]